MSLTEATPRKDRLNLFKLKDAGEYIRWEQQLQEYMFKKIRNVNMGKLKDASTLDSDYFKKHANFKAEFTAIKKAYSDAKEDKEPLDDEDFCRKCKAHAMDEGHGFQDWLYSVYSDIRTALGQTIYEQTAGVRLGDLTGLLKAIKLAVHHYELTNKHALDVEYGKCDMAGAGNNDIMPYLSALSNYIRRLETAGVTIEDGKKQSVLLEGLDQTIFEHFIADARRNPYASYTSLQKAVEEHAALPRVLQKLRALKPGNPQSALPTRNTSKQQQIASDSHRLDKIEAVLTSLTKTQTAAPRKECYKFKNHGTCDRGDTCHFEHIRSGSGRSSNNNNSNSDSSKFCEIHKSNGHDTSECKILKNNPKLKEALANLAGRKHDQVVNKTTSEGDTRGVVPKAYICHAGHTQD